MLPNMHYEQNDQNGSKTIPFGAAHTYMAYIREYPPPTPPPGVNINKLLLLLLLLLLSRNFVVTLAL